MTLHTIAPVFDENSKILVLGSFPSVKSREEGFFYGHPQNRFWKVIANAFDTQIPQSIEEKKALLLLNGIALWDVIHSCDIVGSSDSSIKNVVPNDISKILKTANIEKIITNGKKADSLYKKYIEKYNIKDVVIGSIFTNYISEETVHFSNKNELFYTKNSDEDMIISELSKITNVYKRSSEVMYKYNVSNHIEKVKNEVAKLLEGDNSGHGL